MTTAPMRPPLTRTREREPQTNRASLEWRVVKDLTDLDANPWLQAYCRKAMKRAKLRDSSPAHQERWMRVFLKSLLAEKFLAWAWGEYQRKKQGDGKAAFDVRRRTKKATT